MSTAVSTDSAARAKPRRALVYAGWAALLSQGSPVGALATLVAFAAFGHVLGRLADGLAQGENALRHANRRWRRLSEVASATERRYPMSIPSKALLMWFALLAAMFANGAFRALALQPRFGERLGRQLSAVTGIGLVFALSGLFVRRVGPTSRRELVVVGLVWLALTLAFEFLFGHYVSGASWQALLADYDLAQGHLWPLVLVATLLAPLLWGLICNAEGGGAR